MAPTVSDVLTPDVVSISAATTVGGAAQLMRHADIGTVVVTEHGLSVVSGDRVVGIVSLGDLAVERDPGSVLGRI